MLPLLILILYVTGCASVPANDYCLIASDVALTDSDVDVISDELARWLLTHSDTYRAICKN